MWTVLRCHGAILPERSDAFNRRFPCDGAARADTAAVAFVYHLCSPNMRGTTLYPLNGPYDRFPDLYAVERVKYDGREQVLTYQVPHLGVAWTDTVNLAALDPRLLVAARRRLGVPLSRLLERRLACIPVERIGDTPAVVYDSASHWVNSSPGQDVPVAPPDSEFSLFDAATYEELAEVPPRHLEYLAERLEHGEDALGFVFVRHVLVAGPLDLSDIELLDL